MGGQYLEPLSKRLVATDRLWCGIQSVEGEKIRVVKEEPTDGRENGVG